jgi:hypothetical protein
MLMKPREFPIDLQVRCYLKERMNLTEEDLQHYFNDVKGFEGEKRFDTMLETLPHSSFLELQDLLLKWNNSTFQIDSLLISQQKIYYFEVKNYEGEWYMEGNKWYWLSGDEKQNPLLQLERSHLLLRQLLKPLNVKLPIEPYLIFVNPEFTLYQAPKDLPIILPTQINRFLKKLSMTTSKPGQSHFNLAKKLASLHVEESIYSRSRVPAYSYDQLEKGIICGKCGLLSVLLHDRRLVCQSCRYEELFELGVKRAVNEYRILFPERKITVSAIGDWCGIAHQKKRIHKLLKNYLTLVRNGRFSYYK